MARIASYNVENLFERPKALNQATWSAGKPILDTYTEVNKLFENITYSSSDKKKIIDLLIKLDIYCDKNNAVRRNFNSKWAWLRKNRGKFDREPKKTSESVEIIANGRADWIGWVELAKEPVNETSIQMTAQVIREVDADIIGIIEAEDRPSLVQFNKVLPEYQYQHVMLVDGNDERGIDVGIMTGNNYEIVSMRSNVDNTDDVGVIFSRDCPQYTVRTPKGMVVHILVNHFKSQSGGGGDKRQRQAAEVRRIVNDLVDQGEHVIVLGDLNEGPKTGTSQAENLFALYDNNSPLVECYTIPGFEMGNKPGTFDSCGLSNRFDYIFISKSLQPKFKGGGVFRKGLWGSRINRPTDWETYDKITNNLEQASDHAVVYVDLDI